MAKYKDVGARTLENVKKKPDGELAATDEVTFGHIVEAICEQFKIESPVDIMAANRMAAIFMKMRYCEAELARYGLFLKVEQDDGSVLPKVNEIAYYYKQLESEFRAYYRLLSGKRNPNQDSAREVTISDLLEQHGEKTKKKSKKKSKK